MKRGASIGDLRHRVTIRVNTPTENQYGEKANVWSEVETVYARVRPMTGEERLSAARVGSNVTHQITMRYRNDLGIGDVSLTAKHQLRYDSRDFEVVYVIDLGECHRWLSVLAREVAA